MQQTRTRLSIYAKQIGGQTKAIWGLVTTIAGVGFSFIIWYIQALGVR